MTILFFARRFYPDIGGVEKHVLNVSRELLAQGYRIIVVADATDATVEDQYQLLLKKNQRKTAKWQMRYISDKTAGKDEEIAVSGRNSTSLAKKRQKTENGMIKENSSDQLEKAAIQAIDSPSSDSIIVYRLPKVKDGRVKKIFIWMWLWKNRKIIKTADIVHCHDVFFWYLPFRFVFPRKPVYTTFHGYESYPIKTKAILIRKLSEWLSRGNICIGDFITKWYHTKPTVVSYGAVDVGQLASPLINDMSAVFIGRLDEQTGITTYVEAVEKIRQKYPRFHFTIVGDGSLKNQLQERFTLLGFQPHIEDYLQKNRYAFVSRYLGILEAMAAKRLVFAVYDNPVKKDYLTMTPYVGWIVLANTADELAEKVGYYMSHPEKEKEMVEKAYHWVKSQSWKRMTAIYTRLWGIS